MSWAEVIAINSNPVKSLDKYNYDLFYEMAKMINRGYGDKNSEVFVVPEYYESVPVAEFANGTMKIVILPRNTKGLSNSCFSGCANLETVIMTDGISNIDANAFNGCTNLKVVKLPKTVTSMFVNTFDSSVEHIFVPWGEGEVANSPWGATNATIHYNSV